MKILLGLISFCTLLFFTPVRGEGNIPDYSVKVNRMVSDKPGTLFNMGTAVNPSGATIHVTTQSVLYDGKPVLPVMGEFHYSRFSDAEWRKELLKMKAGGITIVATYIFWIHHEEIWGVYDWEGQRNLRKFVETCRDLDLPVVLRVGPWCHGEVRNGGLPEWLVTSDVKLREDHPAYLDLVRVWFSKLYEQVKGLMWKDGGPVIGVQIENEYGGRGTHLITLKQMLREIGFDVPLYTRTGWPKLRTPVPYGEIIPLYGDYADGFWDRSLAEMPGDYGKSYIFRSFRNSTVIATEILPQQSAMDHPEDVGYPYFTCELGGGMMTSYHRRIAIDPMDVYAMALVRVGSGSNLPGYYMYHGGTNPEGKLTTLNERQASNHTFSNDLPVRSYDFQAPVGEFGRINPHYHLLRKLHLFLHDFGSELTSMAPVFPERTASDFRSDSLVRWAVRSNGVNGYVFVNNYHRLKTLCPKENIQFTINLPEETLVLPETPVSIPSGSAFFFPFNMQLGNFRLIYSTAQPVTKVTEGDNTTFVFAQIPEIPSEFVFDATHLKAWESSGEKPQKKNNRLYFKNVTPGKGVAIRLQDNNHNRITILLLDGDTALSCWKGELAGMERLFISGSELTFHKNQLELEDTVDRFSVSMYPAPESLMYKGKALKGLKTGVFTEYTLRLPESKPFHVKLEKIQEAGLPLRQISMGKKNVAEMPDDSDFVRSACWKIVLPEQMDTTRDNMLRISYTGDVARVYSKERLLTDNFYNGKSFNLDLRYFIPQLDTANLMLKILPLQKDAPIYLPETAQPDFKDSDYLITTPVIEVIEKRTVLLIANE